MGTIRDHVFHNHLTKFPFEREQLLPFLANFDVNFAQRKIYKGTQVSIYFLNPDQTIQDQFGINSEIMLIISDYKTIQPRTMQAIEDAFQTAPAKGRVDQTTYFLVTREPAADWVLDYCSLNPQSRIPVILSYSKIREKKDDQWLVRSMMSSQLYARDLFNEQLPLISDQFFFGRDKLIAELVTASKQSQNRGLFGLRKTGKTSVLFKFQRIARSEGVIVIYYDCKDPAIRSMDWEQLLDRISRDLLKEAGKNPNTVFEKDTHVSDRFRTVVKSITGSSRCCIIFDEIEYISPIAKLDTHWHSDFIPFWQTIWTTQSQTRKMSFIIAGVNPSVVELDLIQGVQNPIFGIISPQYLTGLEYPETRTMLHHFGKRMGLKFDHTSCTYIFERFGGHPLLTRMAGSFINNALPETVEKRPVSIDKKKIEVDEEARELEMSFYCGHVTNELKVFYPDEYEMLEMLASGNLADFIELSKDPTLINHLSNYGLVDNIKGQKPKIKIPALERFINLERKKRTDTDHTFFRVSDKSRESWLQNRINRIISDSRLIESLARKAGEPEVFGTNGFPESEKFAAIRIIDDQSSFIEFINVCNRCLVESVERNGRKIGIRNYFWNDFKDVFPYLFDGLLRVKLYRNDQMHLELYEATDEKLRDLLKRDFRGQDIRTVKDPYKLLQQIVLDGLFVGLQLEIDKRS